MNSVSHTSSPVISVVIVNYNVKDFLVSCLHSLQASLRGIPSEIIVVDNNSTDGSIDYVEPIFPDVIFVRLPDNPGFGKANNIGFQMALEHGAEFILCLNPDTLIGEDTMSVMLEYMRSHPEVGLSGCKALNADGTFQLACRRGFPTPWASFCKVFGLQALFPKSRLFAQYNQTFRSENETYFVDAVAGSFMFMRREALEAVRGFDEDFFMYGEDLDLCYRITLAGWKITYVHTTSIIHYKGESTRRSAINEVKVFYEAMEIFAQKHFGSSRLFLLFLRAGIFVRSTVAYLSYYRQEVGMMLADIAALNGALLLAMRLWKGRWLSFPDYAYPTVFVVLSCVTLLSMLLAGEYTPYDKPSVRKAISGLMASFFLLSALTYFFKDYAFSRGVLLLTIGVGLVFTVLLRIVFEVAERVRSRDAEKRVLFIGHNDVTRQLIARIQESTALPELSIVSSGVAGGRGKARIVGVVTTEFVPTGTIVAEESFIQPLVIGNIHYLRKLVEQYAVDEVIITDTAMPRGKIMRYIMEAAETNARRKATFRFAQEYDDVIAGRIVERYAGVSQSFVQYNLGIWKYKLLKRVIDIVGAIFILTIGLPVVILRKRQDMLSQYVKVLRGTRSLIGHYPINNEVHTLGKVGLTGLAHINSPEQLSEHAIRTLNEFYARHYSLWLDIEILMTLFFRKRPQK